MQIFQKCSYSSALTLKIDVETMKATEDSTQDRTPDSTVESEGSHIDGHQKALTVPLPSGQTQSSCAGAEAPQCSYSSALKLKIDVETTKPSVELSTQDRTPDSTVESEGSQIGGHQKAFPVPLPSGQTQPSCTDAEAPQSPTSPIPTEGEVLRLIAVNYLQTTQPSSKDDFDSFLAYMKDMRLTIAEVRVGSLLITMKCDSLQILERLWEDYSSGYLGKEVQRCFVTEEILTQLGLAELKLKTTMSEEEYQACKKYLGKDPGRG